MGLGHQLGELFLGAVPTVLILIVLYFILKSFFFKPLLAVMAEREKRTAGAQRAAETAQAAAGEKVKQYQEALKQARAKVYAEQEAARKKLLDERAALVRASRNLAAAEVSAAKEKVAKEVATAKRELEAGVPQLAAEIAKRVMETATPGDQLDRDECVCGFADLHVRCIGGGRSEQCDGTCDRAFQVDQLWNFGGCIVVGICRETAAGISCQRRDDCVCDYESDGGEGGGR